MITMLYRNFMPIIFRMERVHTDFKEGDAVPTKVKLIHMEKFLHMEVSVMVYNTSSHSPNFTMMQSVMSIVTLTPIPRKVHCPR